MNLIEKTIGFISPSWALSREQHRLHLEALRRYEGTGRGKRLRHRRPPSTSAQTEVSRAHADLRNQARFLRRNNPWAKRGIVSFVSNVVGSGIKLSIDGTNARAIARMEEDWKAWAGTTACDFYGKRNLYGLQRQVVRSVFSDGEVLIRRVRDGRVPLKLQVLEADYLVSQTLTIESMVNRSVQKGHKLQDGIEFDRVGKVVAYHIYETHPGHQDVRNGMKTIRVPAADMLHIFKGDRPGQHRGITELESTIIRLNEIDGLEDANLVKQKIAASFAVFIHNNQTGRPGAPDDDGYQTERIEPGMIERLNPGEQVSVAAPADSGDFADMMTRSLQGVAAGMLNTYENLTGDYGNVNFSSGRMGWIEHQRLVEEWQDEVVIVQMCNAVWEWFKVAATISSTDRARGKYTITWTPPRREMLDPVKETKGILEKLRAGLISWQDAVREMGYDPDVLFAQIVADRQRFNEAELKTTADPAHDANAQDDSGDGDGNDGQNRQ